MRDYLTGKEKERLKRVLTELGHVAPNLEGDVGDYLSEAVQNIELALEQDAEDAEERQAEDTEESGEEPEEVEAVDDIKDLFP